jgi:hypothetical protein
MFRRPVKCEIRDEFEEKLRGADSWHKHSDQ